ncbi:peptidyl-tRNA hydrolase, PTH2 [Kipferlia bialata]|uniref:peptidyl-tRNA hydrolase n=1 Tax=Kipferlia bialata TaxID=797122 RepID=A0A9K3D852_9EUKA|nr:peptidyl-tRNA hydrolase, PTH2 [Kipferlia bialata]|eukprot:g11496.t1
MQKGKIAAQVGHACVMAATHPMLRPGPVSEAQDMETPAELVGNWLHQGQMKIVLKVQSLAQLREVLDQAHAAGLPTYEVHDAGHTQVEPGSVTVGAIGPAPVEWLDPITGPLKLM